MGTFSVTFEIGDLQGTRFQRLEGLVDSGATFTVVPGAILEALGIRPLRKATFALGNEEIVGYDVGAGLVRLAGLEGPTYVVFGDPGIQPHIGAVTLEGLLLGIDPVNHVLVPVTGLLKHLQSERAP